MKKAVTVLLIMILILPIVVRADNKMPDISGIWILERKKDISTWCVYTLQIHEDNLAFYSVDSYTKKEPVETSANILSWSYKDNEIKFTKDDDTIMTLYYIDEYHLSSDPRGTYGIYTKTPSTQQEYNDQQIVDIINEINLSPIGCWALPHNYSTLEDNYMFTTTYFFLSGNGSAYRMSFGLKNGDINLSIASDNGIWIGDNHDITIRLSDDTYKAHIDSTGQLIVDTGDVSLSFYRMER